MGYSLQLYTTFDDLIPEVILDPVDLNAVSLFLDVHPTVPVSLSECVVRTDSTSKTVLLPTLAGQWSEATPRVWRCFTWKTEHFQFYQKHSSAGTDLG